MKKIIMWIVSLFGNFQKAFEKFKPIAEKVVEYINTIKAGVESGTLDSLAALSPSSKDDVIVQKIKAAFQKIAKEAAAVEGLITGNESSTEALTQLGLYLTKNSKKARLKFWVELAGKLMEAVSDGKLTISEAIALTQLIYSNFKK